MTTHEILEPGCAARAADGVPHTTRTTLRHRAPLVPSMQATVYVPGAGSPPPHDARGGHGGGGRGDGSESQAAAFLAALRAALEQSAGR